MLSSEMVVAASSHATLSNWLRASPHLSFRNFWWRGRLCISRMRRSGRKLYSVLSIVSLNFEVGGYSMVSGGVTCGLILVWQISVSGSSSLSLSLSVVELGVVSGSEKGVVVRAVQGWNSFPTSVLCLARQLKPWRGAVWRVQS
jgi:hypothetical protein